MNVVRYNPKVLSVSFDGNRQVNAGAEEEPWIGVDLDGTLAHYEKWEGPDKIGKPIPKMVRLIKMHLRRGDVVKIFTARVADDPKGVARAAIENWCLKVFGQKLPITNIKDQGMTKLYDDRAVGVEPNTGELKAVEEQKCPHCGSSDYVLLPADFETAKCQQCGKTWDHGIVDGINDPYSSSQDDGMEAYSDDEPRDERGRWTAGDTNTDRTKWHFGDYNANDKINGVPLKFASKPDFSKLVNPDLHEEPMRVPKWAHASAGVVMIEPDHKVWVVTPENYYGGYRNTFPKGTVESGESLQETAVRETYEESGLLAKITGVLGDVQRGTSVARYYIGQRVGGSPAMAGEETYAVKLMDLHDRATDERLLDVRNKPTADSQVLDLVRQHLGIAAPPKEESQVPDAGVIMHQKTGGAQGSNAGGFYKGSDGVDRYVKFYKTPEQGQGEALANTIYRDLGVGAPKSQIFALPNGKQGFASEIIPGGKTLEQTGLTKQNAQEVMKGFAADVLTANWDAVGLTHDNILLKGNEAHRVDNGAAFLYRAQGAPKPPSLLNQATEIKSFFNPAVNYAYAAVAKKAGYQSVQDIPSFRSQVEKIVQLRDASGGWDKYLDAKAPYVSSAQRDKIVEMLNARTHALSDAAGIKASIAAYSESEPRNEKGEWTEEGFNKEAAETPAGVYYHGTQWGVLDDVARNGLVIGKGQGAAAWAETNDSDLAKAGKTQQAGVYLTKSRHLAWAFAQMATQAANRKLPGAAPLMFKLALPDKLLRRTESDEQTRFGGSLRSLDYIPKRFITDYSFDGKTWYPFDAKSITKLGQDVRQIKSAAIEAYSESEPRDESGKWTSGGILERNPAKEVTESIRGVSHAPALHRRGVPNQADGLHGEFNPQKGGIVFHGTGKTSFKLKPGETYTAVDYNETHAFARGEIPGAGGGPSPKTMALQAKPGKTLDVNDAVTDVLRNGDEEDMQKVFAEARAKGARYVTFMHPSSVGDKEEFPVIVPLYPDQDLKSMGGWSLKAQADSLLARALGLLISAQTEGF